MKYKHLWADMHSNIHHNQMDQLPLWLKQAKDTMDFWPIAYYPYHMEMSEYGLALEDLYPESEYLKDWQLVKEMADKANSEGFPMFMGYEWQGDGSDGDHNVFFLENDGKQLHPRKYADLVKAFENQHVIGIPHHVAYQLGSRGKNWNTHNEKFSPFAEIYSSHGLSENDEGPIGMNRHVHMGPRVSTTDYEKGLEKGYKVGCIASGDNHNIPNVYGFGQMCALCSSNDKLDIWDALINRRVYGVSGSRIKLEFNVNNKPMGSVVETDGKVKVEIKAETTSALDRIELIKDNVVCKLIGHSGLWENKPLGQTVRFKFRIDFGWGPDIRIFKDEIEHDFKGYLSLEKGRIISVEKCWSNFGQKVIEESEKKFGFELTSHQSTTSGKWMGSCVAANEGFIFEVESDINEVMLLSVNGKEFTLAVKDVLADSRIIAFKDEAEKLINEKFGPVTHYRDDYLWHNSYKIKVYKGYPDIALTKEVSLDMDVEKSCSLRVRVYQKNGEVAFSSPVFIEKKEK